MSLIVTVCSLVIVVAPEVRRLFRGERSSLVVLTVARREVMSYVRSGGLLAGVRESS